MRQRYDIYLINDPGGAGYCELLLRDVEMSDQSVTAVFNVYDTMYEESEDAGLGFFRVPAGLKFDVKNCGPEADQPYEERLEDGEWEDNR